MASNPGLDLRSADERTQLKAFLDEYRRRLPDRLDGLDEEQARRRIVPSKTTLLGLVKHMNFEPHRPCRHRARDGPRELTTCVR